MRTLGRKARVHCWRALVLFASIGSFGGCGSPENPSQPEQPKGSIQFHYFVNASQQACAVCRDPNCGPDGCDPGCGVVIMLKQRTTGSRDSLDFEAYVGGDGHIDGYLRESKNGVWMDCGLSSSAPRNTYDITLSRIPEGSYKLTVELRVSFWEPTVIASATMDSVAVGDSVTSVGTVNAFRTVGIADYPSRKASSPPATRGDE